MAAANNINGNNNNINDNNIKDSKSNKNDIINYFNCNNCNSNNNSNINNNNSSLFFFPLRGCLASLTFLSRKLLMTSLPLPFYCLNFLLSTLFCFLVLIKFFSILYFGQWTMSPKFYEQLLRHILASKKYKPKM